MLTFKWGKILPYNDENHWRTALVPPLKFQSQDGTEMERKQSLYGEIMYYMKQSCSGYTKMHYNHNHNNNNNNNIIITIINITIIHNKSNQITIL